jgi:hypothetical protein
VRSRNLENEEAKVCYRAVENTTTMGCNTKKTNNKQFGTIDSSISIVGKERAACARKVYYNVTVHINIRNLMSLKQHIWDRRISLRFHILAVLFAFFEDYGWYVNCLLLKPFRQYEEMGF